MPDVGQLAPDFTPPVDRGGALSLSSHRRRGIPVLGISADGVDARRTATHAAQVLVDLAPETSVPAPG